MISAYRMSENLSFASPRIKGVHVRKQGDLSHAVAIGAQECILFRRGGRGWIEHPKPIAVALRRRYGGKDPRVPQAPLGGWNIVGPNIVGLRSHRFQPLEQR